ncbi:MAG: PHP domain-containing protein, partial [Proteobacteria bacterium]
MYLIFDTETTGLPKRWDAPISDTANWPRAIQIAWQLHDALGNLVEHQDFLIRPEGFNIPYDAERIHGISTELAIEQGIALSTALEKFQSALSKTKFIVGQNVGFDINIMGCEFYRLGINAGLSELPVLDTCTEVTAELLKIPGGRGGKFKLPTLTELHQYLFNTPFSEAHNATADVEATTRCFLELIRREVFTKEELHANPDFFAHFRQNNPSEIKSIGLRHLNLKAASEAIRERLRQKQDSVDIDLDNVAPAADLSNAVFAHLHNHTQFSVLQSTISVPALVSAAAKAKMPAVAMTDVGNMMGAFQFVSAVMNHNKAIAAANKEAEEKGEAPTGVEMKPIVGAEFYVCEDHKD